jgi:hypothetical protein
VGSPAGQQQAENGATGMQLVSVSVLITQMAILLQFSSGFCLWCCTRLLLLLHRQTQLIGGQLLKVAKKTVMPPASPTSTLLASTPHYMGSGS